MLSSYIEINPHFTLSLSCILRKLSFVRLVTLRVHTCLLSMYYFTKPLSSIYFEQNVDDIFEPVTWHHQRRPFIRALTCKTTKTRRGVAGRASSDDQVNPIFIWRGETEREREREKMALENRSFFNNFCTPFYIPACYMSILPLSSILFHVKSNIISDRIGGDRYFPNNYPPILLSLS